MRIPPPDNSAPRHGLLSVAERDGPPARSAPAAARPGMSTPTAPPPPAPIEPEFLLSLEERALIEEEAARSAFRAFQEVKDEIPLRPGEIERLKLWAIAAAESYVKIQKAREREASQTGPSSDLSARHEKVLAAERLLRQARETERGLAETASDDLAIAIVEARAAKAPMERLQWEVAQGRSHTADEMNQAQDVLIHAGVKLMIAAETKVEAWRRAWAVAVLDDPNGEGDEVPICARERDRAEAEKRKLDQEGI
jgi:hypothetical protein